MAEREFAVVAVPDGSRGEMIEFYVMPRDTRGPLSETGSGSIYSRLSSHLIDCQRPNIVVCMPVNRTVFWLLRCFEILELFSTYLWAELTVGACSDCSRSCRHEGHDHCGSECPLEHEALMVPERHLGKTYQNERGCSKRA
jgi:hypothetical protein